MIRITAGKYKNIKLKVPDSARPLTDRIRLSLFDTINEFIENAKVLDLYAGSGITGLEAISRGAKSCTFIDNDEEAVKIITANVLNSKLEEFTNIEIINSNVKSFISESTNEGVTFDLIFLDPPFDNIFNLNLNILKKILSKEGLIIARLPRDITKKQLDDLKLEKVYSKNYGKSQLIFYRK